MILDTVWMVVAPRNKGVIYCIGCSAAEVWSKIELDEVMGTGVTATSLRAKGYRAKKVNIVLETDEEKK